MAEAAQVGAAPSGEAPATTPAPHAVDRQARHAEGIEVAAGRALGHLQLGGDLGRGHLAPLLEQEEDGHQPIGAHARIFARKPAT